MKTNSTWKHREKWSFTHVFIFYFQSLDMHNSQRYRPHAFKTVLTRKIYCFWTERESRLKNCHRFGYIWTFPFDDLHQLMNVMANECLNTTDWLCLICVMRMETRLLALIEWQIWKHRKRHGDSPLYKRKLSRWELKWMANGCVLLNWLAGLA